MLIIQLNNSVYIQFVESITTVGPTDNNSTNKYKNRHTRNIAPLSNITVKMFSLDNFDLEATMARHFFEGSQATNASSSSSEFFFGDDDNTSESDEDDAYSSGFNSDQENNEKRQNRIRLREVKRRRELHMIQSSIKCADKRARLQNF
ncbi:uncharacterized protein [Eurosta solidaginis]|uniref:uncharacterized protein n=1 Tax=Eurosta solidaginis TaxID=178769 RepID=UPI0035307C21